MSLKDTAQHREVADQSGGAEGNERLTAITGAVLLVLLAAEGVTILRIHGLLTLHFFLGMLLVGPVTLKIGSTCYRFVRYYSGSPAYVRKGPPTPLLRLLGPVVIITSVCVLGSGVALAFTGPGTQIWLAVHKVFFVLWFGAMTIHVLWYVPRLPALLTSPCRDRVRGALAGAGRRWLLLAASLGGGLVLAMLTTPRVDLWTGLPQKFGG